MKNILSQEEINTIHDLCKEYKIKNYTINSDGSIDATGEINLSSLSLDRIPIKFNKVNGNFICSNNNLTTLENCPKEVTGHFACNDNSKLTTLLYAPEIVGDISFYNKIIPKHFVDLYYDLNQEEGKIFIKYQNDMGIWNNGYDEEGAQLLSDDIKDGLL